MAGIIKSRTVTIVHKTYRTYLRFDSDELRDLYIRRTGRCWFSVQSFVGAKEVVISDVPAPTKKKAYEMINKVLADLGQEVV